LPARSQPGAIHLLTAQVHLVDAPCVGDVVERIGIQHDEVGVSSRRDQSRVHLRDVGRLACGRDNNFGRRHADRNQRLQFQVCEVGDAVPNLTCIRSKAHPDTRGPQTHRVAAVQFETAPGARDLLFRQMREIVSQMLLILLG